MTIEDLGDVIGVDLIIRRYANQDNRYMCEFKSTETKTHKDDPVLSGEYGSGNSPTQAVADYVRIIRGKWLVIDSRGNDRKEFGVPETLTEV